MSLHVKPHPQKIKIKLIFTEQQTDAQSFFSPLSSFINSHTFRGQALFTGMPVTGHCLHTAHGKSIKSPFSALTSIHGLVAAREGLLILFLGMHIFHRH